MTIFKIKIIEIKNLEMKKMIKVFNQNQNLKIIQILLKKDNLKLIKKS